MKNENETISAAELADILGVSKKTIASWATSGIVVRKAHGEYDFRESVKSFAKHMRDRGSGDATAVTAVATERGALLRVQRQRAELELAREEGQLLKLADVEAHWCSILRTLRSACLAIPTRVASRVSGLNREVVHEIDQEIRLALTEMAQSGYPSSGC